jgi:AcrR family transcriptional regulator
MAATTRTGRRPGNSGSKEAILDAARELFAARGYDGASIRAIAGRAGVDPGLVMHFFGTKEGVFVAAMQLPYVPSETIPGIVAGGPPEEAGRRVAGFFVQTWDTASARSPMLALVRSSVSEGPATDMLREFIQSQVVRTVAGAIRGPGAELRASLVASQMVGLAMARYVVGVEPLASASQEEVVAAMAPALQALLAGDGIAGAPGGQPPAA